MTASSNATSIFTAGTSSSERQKNGMVANALAIDAPAPTVHANRVGVAAYLSIMNPAPAISMQTEA